MTTGKQLLDFVYDNETKLADKIWFTQPIGAGQVVEYTWAQAMEQARRMAARRAACSFR